MSKYKLKAFSVPRFDVGEYYQCHICHKYFKKDYTYGVYINYPCYENYVCNECWR